MVRSLFVCAALATAVLVASPSYAQEDPEVGEPPAVYTEPAVTYTETADRDHPREMIMVELTGAYGFQFGSTEYLPDASPTASKHPFVNGFAFGLTAGFGLAEHLWLVANYEYTSAKSVTGSITTPPILDEVQGAISYQSIAVGLRLGKHLGPGHLHAEFALGVLLPYETELTYTYGAGLAPAGITGEGTTTRDFGLGFGGHGILGYTFDIAGRFYVGPALKAKTYVTNNSGKETRLVNFVTDFTAQPAPTATTATITHETSGMSRPTTNSVQDLRLQLVLGARF
jgi:hypothetical protein